MTEATATKIVGAQTGLFLTSSSCEFKHDKDYLRIAIESQTLRSAIASQCKSGTEPVKGVGNEAVACDGAASEQLVVGRVREKVFTLRLEAAFTRDLLRAKVSAAAEIVSGNLY